MRENYKKWNWVTNPFVLKIDPKLFTGYETQVNALNQHIENKHKIALISGPTGAGKTTLLKWLETNHKNIFYLAKPPQNPEDFVDIFLQRYPLGFFEKILRKKPTLYNLPEYMNKKSKTHFIFLLDEAHETNKEVLEWLRVLTDQINMTLIVAGLPNLEQNVKNNLQTFDQRVTTRVSLLALNNDETKELIKKRIESVGGTGLVPFTLDAADKIFQRTGGFPREVLKLCDRAVLSASDKGLEKIDIQDIELFREIEMPKVRLEQPKVAFTPKPPSENQMKGLPYKQRKILETLSKKDWLTPTAIVDEIGSERYKSHSHGVRSVNNILKRLLIEGYVQREAHGKGFLYSLTPKVKTLFVQN